MADARAFVSEDEHPPSVFIRAHQEALILHGGRYGLYEVYRIYHPDEPPEAWRWEKVVPGARGGPRTHHG